MVGGNMDDAQSDPIARSEMGRLEGALRLKVRLLGRYAQRPSRRPSAGSERNGPYIIVGDNAQGPGPRSPDFEFPWTSRY